jgi:hypothetical protein
MGPYTVLVDPVRARAALSREGNATLSEKVAYIYRLQQMEAEAIAINKIDRLRPEELAEVTGLLQDRFPAQRILSFSARSGAGFDELATWLLGPGASRLPSSPDIDYDVYAAGEAELAWFDGRFEILAQEPLVMDDALMQLGVLLRERLSAAGLEIAHVKLLLHGGDSVCALSIPRSDAPPELSRTAGKRAQSLDLLVNACVAARPDDLSAIVNDCLRSWAALLEVSISDGPVSSFSPPRPVPTHRIESDESSA